MIFFAVVTIMCIYFYKKPYWIKEIPNPEKNKDFSEWTNRDADEYYMKYETNMNKVKGFDVFNETAKTSLSK